MSETDTYKITADYYDAAYGNAPNLVDLPFYLDLAKRIGGPVFEMGCGTGRVLLPIARAGIEIHGLDSSAAMLRVLQNHLHGEPAEVQRRVVLHEGDMRNFRGRRKYPVITIPFRPLQHMYTVDDQVAALRTEPSI